MPKFLIESPHEADVVACAKVVKIFLSTGSHFLTHAHWGCMDGVHSAWLIVDVADKQEARAILPPAYRADAKITRLTYFSMEQIDATLARHHAAR
jgi:hypothetical protein